MKKLFVILFAACALAFNAKAQGFPGWNLSVQGGVNYTTSNLWEIDHWHHFTPNAQLGLEYQLSPWFGLRGNLSGFWAVHPVGSGKADFNYAQLGLDAMFDIANMFKTNYTRFLSPYVFVGGAGNYRFKTDNADAFFGPGVRAGLGFAFHLGKTVKLVLELQDNALSNKFNTLDDDQLFGGDILEWKRPFRWDDNFAALIGLQFGLTRLKRPSIIDPGYGVIPIVDAETADIARQAAERAAAERAAAEAAARAAAERAAAERAAAEAAARAAMRPAAPASITENVYFDINKSVINASEQSKINNLVNFLRQNPSATVSISGYADKATGTAKRNMTLSEERANVVKKALTDAGIAANRITTSYYGDTQQVSSVPEQNRVVICVTK